MIILDTNIVLEMLEKRSHLSLVKQALNTYHNSTIAVSTLTLSNVFYILDRNKSALDISEKLLKTYQIVGVTAEDADWAFAHYRGNDFEDALHVASAIREQCELFMTLDVALAKKYSKFLNILLIGQ